MKVQELCEMEKNGLLPVTMDEVRKIRKGEVPDRLAGPPWELNLREAEEMLAELFGYTEKVDEETGELV